MLLDGANLLAIQGLNDGINSSDMLIVPELLGGVVSFSPGVYGVSYKWNESGTEAGLVGQRRRECRPDDHDTRRQQAADLEHPIACRVQYLPHSRGGVRALVQYSPAQPRQLAQWEAWEFPDTAPRLRLSGYPARVPSRAPTARHADADRVLPRGARALLPRRQLCLLSPGPWH